MGLSILQVLNGAGVTVKNESAVVSGIRGVMGSLFALANAHGATSQEVADGIVLDALDEVARTGNPPSALDALNDPMTSMFIGMDMGLGMSALCDGFGVDTFEEAAALAAKAHRYAISQGC